MSELKRARRARSRGLRRLLMAVSLVGAMTWALTGQPVPMDVQGHAWFEAGGPEAISHQGVALPGDRVDLEAFVRAVHVYGFGVVETDVRLLREAPGVDRFVLVAHHDIDGSVTSVAELAALPGSTPARVEDLLDPQQFPDVRWNLELKGGDVETAVALAETLRTVPGSAARVCVSYGDITDIDVVADIRRVLPAGTCSCASFPEKSQLFDSGLLRRVTERFRQTKRGTSAGPVACVQLLHNLVTERDVAEAHALGLKVHVWDLALAGSMDAARMHELLDMGVDGIISDNATALQEVFAQRSQTSAR